MTSCRTTLRCSSQVDNEPAAAAAADDDDDYLADICYDDDMDDLDRAGACSDDDT